MFFFFPSQSAVGGGSTVYGGVLYRARPEFFKNPQWNHLRDDWQQVLTPFYDKAEYMLGVETVEFDSTNQNIAKEMAARFGCSDGFKRAPTGVFSVSQAKKCLILILEVKVQSVQDVFAVAHVWLVVGSEQ